MPEVLVEERTCGACGVGVRPDSQFCYNCGESLDDVPLLEDRPIGRPDISEDDGQPILIPNITSKDSSPDPHTRAGATVVDSDGQRLESAASLRRRTRTMERKPVEIVWEPTSGPNIILIVATSILVVFSFVVIGLALYYR